MIDPFILVMIVLPLLTIVASIVLQYLICDKFVTTAVVSMIYVILTFTIFNKTFIAWVIIYSIISFIVSVITDSVTMEVKK